jgi:hypothetical protein
MGARADVPGVIQSTFKWFVQSDVGAITRIFLKYSGVAPSVSNLIDLADVFVTSFGTNIAEWFSEGNGLENVEMVDLTSPTSAVGESTTGPVTGTRAGAPLPGATCVLALYEVARRYRGGHPRSYTPAMIDSDLTTEQTWDPSTLGDFITAWTTFIESGTGSVWTGGGTLTNVNVSWFEGFTAVENPTTGRYRNVPTPRVTPVVDTIVAVHANPAPCFQRRRGLIP